MNKQIRMRGLPPTKKIRPSEARLAGDNNNNILILLPGAKMDDLALNKGESFCGTVLVVQCDSAAHAPTDDVSGKNIFVCGDVAQAPPNWLALFTNTTTAIEIFVVGDLCRNYETALPNAQIVGLGRLPILVNGVGVLYRNFFEPGYFHKIQSEHAFQALTFSNKPGLALRTGIYLTPVEHTKDKNEKHFRLLRCSTNLAGPTADFQSSDHEIVDALNQEAGVIFENAAPVNHVLAQIYHNSHGGGNNSKKKKQRKASIKAHADKTKDMPINGIMAFCTFYDGLGKLKPMGPFDYGHKGVSGLTKLHFCLKETVRNNPEYRDMVEQFNVTLYPDSVFFMPLSTNRWYTHEIRPGTLDSHMLPTRMGYVVRCAATEAVHKSVASKDGPDSATFIKMEDGELVPLEPPTRKGRAELHGLYKEENISADFIDYGRRRFLFSMNAGDYAMPITYNVDGGREEFRKLQLKLGRNLFDDLKDVVRFETLGKGRQGTVLVLPDQAGNVPIVRTTTKYQSPAQKFKPLHGALAEEIQRRAAVPVPFNNALAEVYDNRYAKMGFHSDQAQDLLDGSYIALFSCYKHPDKVNNNRKLVVEPKDGNREGERFEIELNHNSVILFSLDTNRRFRHKIVLDYNKKGNPPDHDEWLGLTFRTSKTFVRFEDESGAILADGTPLKLIPKEADRAYYYRMRGNENREIDFRYPELDYTISESDLMPPVD